MGDDEGTLRIECDDVSMKTNLILSPFVMSGFNEKSFLNTYLGFTAFWNSKPTKTSHVDRPVVYSSDKFLNLSIINKVHLKCDIIDGSILDGKRQPILFSFVSDKRHGYEVFSEPETIIHKKINLF